MHEPTSRGDAGPTEPLRWGFVGTGSIARRMADVVRRSPAAVLAAINSRSLVTARTFAEEFGADEAFDSLTDMLARDDLDAIYISTPTAGRERIAVAAARAGKHVLGEKPFASLASLERITAACRQQGVCFMDATHFVHHPRHAEVKGSLAETIGAPLSLETRFLIDLADRDNIRFDSSLEPLGALGDLGWYNLRATLEYFPAKASLQSVTARIERDPATQAVAAAEGSLAYDDGSVSRWRCSFGSATVDIGLDLAGPCGSLRMKNFIGEDADSSASYDYLRRDAQGAPASIARGNASTSGPALMFRDFAVAVADPVQREHWMRASERTQALLDTVWQASDAGHLSGSLNR